MVWSRIWPIGSQKLILKFHIHVFSNNHMTDG